MVPSSESTSNGMFMHVVVACAIKNAIFSKWNKNFFHLEEGPF